MPEWKSLHFSTSIISYTWLKICAHTNWFSTESPNWQCWTHERDNILLTRITYENISPLFSDIVHPTLTKSLPFHQSALSHQHTLCAFARDKAIRQVETIYKVLVKDGHPSRVSDWPICIANNLNKASRRQRSDTLDLKRAVCNFKSFKLPTWWMWIAVKPLPLSPSHLNDSTPSVFAVYVSRAF